MVPAGLLLIGSEFFRSHDPLRDAARGSAAGVVAMVPEVLVLLTSLACAAGALVLGRVRPEQKLVANIERVAGLFVTKTVYAALIAVAAGPGPRRLCLRSAGRCRRAHPVAPLARTRAAGQVT